MHPIYILFALAMALFASTGCTDASAAESTYMPLHEPCSFGDGEVQRFHAGALGEFDLHNLDFDDDLHDEFESEGDDFDDLDDLNDQQEDRDDEKNDLDDLFDADPHAEPESIDSTTIDINLATAEELTALPGIGPSLAGRIVEYRQDRQFATVHQLERVAGIGPSIMERLQPLIHVE